METSKNFEVREDLRQSEEYGKYIERIGWKAIKIQDPGEANASRSRFRFQIFIRKLGPVSIAKIQRVDLPLPWEKLDQVLKKYRVFMCKLEPLGSDSGFMIRDLRIRGYGQDGWPMLGTKTLRISLSGSRSSIYDSFKKDCRYGIRNAQISMNNVQLNKFENTLNHRSIISLHYSFKFPFVPQGKQISNFKLPFNRFPLLVKNKTELLQQFAKRNIFLGSWYSQPVAPKELRLERVGYTMGSCPNAERINKEIINLPTLVSFQDAQKIVSAIL